MATQCTSGFLSSHLWPPTSPKYFSHCWKIVPTGPRISAILYWTCTSNHTCVYLPQSSLPFFLQQIQKMGKTLSLSPGSPWNLVINGSYLWLRISLSSLHGVMYNLVVVGLLGVEVRVGSGLFSMREGVYSGCRVVLGHLGSCGPDFSSHKNGWPVVLWCSCPLAVRAPSRASLLLMLGWACSFY